MSPVHVLVSESVDDERYYGAAYQGAIDLYRFRSNVEAFERLVSAHAAIDVLVVTPSQGSVFNMDPAQLVARLSAMPTLANSPLAGLQIVVVGASLPSKPANVYCVSTLDAAIRLIKFGQVESAPVPQQMAHQGHPQVLAAVPIQGVPMPSEQPGSALVGSVISAIWDAPDPVDEQRRQQQAAQRAHAEHQALAHWEAQAQGLVPAGVQMQQNEPDMSALPQPGQRVQLPRGTARLRHGGPAAAMVEPPQPQAGGAGLFTHAQVAMVEPMLEPAQPYVVASRGAYAGARTGGIRHSAGVNEGAGGAYDTAQPQHQQLAAQVQQLVYQTSPSSGSDPLLGFSMSVQQQVAAQQQAEQHQYQQSPHRQVQAYAPQPAMYAPVPSGGVPHPRGMVKRARDRVLDGERAPTVPQAPRPIQHVARQVGAPTANFVAPAQLLQRAESAGEVSFG